MVRPSRQPPKRPQAKRSVPQAAPRSPAVQSPSLPSETSQSRSAPGSWLASLGAIALLLAAAGGSAGSMWLAVQLMVNPQQLLWLNRYIPDWIPIPVTGLKPPQTLSEIQAEIAQTGAIAGEMLSLSKNRSVLDGKVAASDLMLPVLLERSPCLSDCRHVKELRIYQTSSEKRHPDDRATYYQLVMQQAIVGPEESFALAPLVDARSANQGSPRILPLTNLQRFQGLVPKQGVWLNLSGKFQRDNETVAYGKIVHYNPARFHLSLMLDWTSPTGQEPIWQEVTGGGAPELVVNQTIGMEPGFKIYQVKPINFLPNPIQLEPISLFDPAQNQSSYAAALVLARSGLWTTGWQRLQNLKSQIGNAQSWSAGAQAQTDLIRLHAQSTRMQAETAWASPSQQVLANLIDGRWSETIQVLEQNLEHRAEILALLKADAGRLRKRVEALLKVDPTQAEAKTWGALLVTAKRDRAAAATWLNQQPKTTPAEKAKILRLVDRLTSPNP